MNRTFTVRKAESTDLARLVAFTLAEARDAEGIELSPETVRKGVQRGLENPKIAQYWIMEDHQGNPIGSVSVVKEWSDWRAGYYWWIQSMFILPEFRGQGLMETLLGEVRERARAEGALDMRLYVHQGNMRAIKAYQRVGFSVTPYQIMITDLS